MTIYPYPIQFIHNHHIMLRDVLQRIFADFEDTSARVNISELDDNYVVNIWQGEQLTKISVKRWIRPGWN